MLQDPIDTSKIQRALVIKLRHHGDVLLSAPVFHALHNHIPGIEVDALIYADSYDMLSLHPAIAQIHVIDRNSRHRGLVHQIRSELRLWAALRARHYDLLVQLTEHPRGATLARLLNPRYAVARLYPGRRGRAWRRSFTHLYDVPARPRHTVETHLDALRRLGLVLTSGDRSLDLVPGAEAERKIESLLSTHDAWCREGFVVVHPTSRWLFKSWPEERMRDLLQRMVTAGERIILTCGPAPDELAMNARISRGIKGLLDLSGTLSLKELAALIGKARLLISIDSAPMHIASAMRTPVVALFGPSGDLEWGPWQVPSRVVTSAHSCRPCHLAGCGDGRVSECLNAISVDQVWNAVLGLREECHPCA